MAIKHDQLHVTCSSSCALQGLWCSNQNKSPKTANLSISEGTKKNRIICCPWLSCDSVTTAWVSFTERGCYFLPPSPASHPLRALKGRKIGLPFEQLICGNIWGEKHSEVPGECLVLIASLKPEQLHWGRGYICKMVWRPHCITKNSGTLSLHVQRAYS